MAYIMGAVTLSPTSGMTPLFNVPPGLCNVTFWNSNTANCFVGTSTSVTTANGLQCHSIPTNFYSYISNRGATFYGTIATNGGTAVINYLIVTNQ